MRRLQGLQNFDDGVLIRVGQLSAPTPNEICVLLTVSALEGKSGESKAYGRNSVGGV